MTSPLQYHTVWLSLGVLMIAAVVVLSLVPDPPSVPSLPHLDKLEHALTYAVLMAWFAQLYPRGRHHGWALGLIGLGVALEFAQAQTGYRSFELADMLADAAGVAAGWALGATAFARCLTAFEHRILHRRNY